MSIRSGIASHLFSSFIKKARRSIEGCCGKVACFIWIAAKGALPMGAGKHRKNEVLGSRAHFHGGPRQRVPCPSTPSNTAHQRHPPRPPVNTTHRHHPSTPPLTPPSNTHQRRPSTPPSNTTLITTHQHHPSTPPINTTYQHRPSTQASNNSSAPHTNTTHQHHPPKGLTESSWSPVGVLTPALCQNSTGSGIRVLIES